MTQQAPPPDTKAPDPEHPALEEGSRCKILILGAGYGGLYYAVRLIQAGFSPSDIRIVDSAGGYGGTWYWNRYPGLMCDVESYIYMPLLEETGYMPKHKYAYGPELREHAERVADKWNLRPSTLFRASVPSLTWDDTEKNWVAKIVRKRNFGDDLSFDVRAQFVCTASGLLNIPQLPKLPGLDKFKGHSFHTSRWDYNYTGGSPSTPELTGLVGKRVVIIGTGATAVQAVPELAKFAKELYVIQRTPSAVDRRDNRPTDPAWWASEIQDKKGWQRTRTENFHAFSCNAPELPSVNLVDDGWTHMPTYSAITGSPVKVTMENVASHLANLHGLDFVRQQQIRNRVDEIVTDKATAEKLKPWYQGWCKRPCFHDEYLQSFNLPHVKLVDTEGKGVDSLTETGVVVKGVEYPADVLIFSTGFRVGKPGTSIIGRNGLTMETKWRDSLGTLHGAISRDFPNLFLNGPAQATASPNFSYVIDQLAKHAAHIISTALKRTGDRAKVTIEPAADAEEAWTLQCMSGSAGFAAIVGCTPSYYNGEGGLAKIVDQAMQMKLARGALWGQGVTSYVEVVENWRKEGNMIGIEVKTYE